MHNHDPEPLVAAARQAAANAYAPYSEFPVGAALLTTGGTLYTGCNVENSSYGLTICAERVALFKALSAGERSFAALAVAGDSGRVITPCGACRQVLAEFCAADTPVFLASLTGAERQTSTIGALLPHAFHTSAQRKGVS